MTADSTEVTKQQQQQQRRLRRSRSTSKAPPKATASTATAATVRRSLRKPVLAAANTFKVQPVSPVFQEELEPIVSPSLSTANSTCSYGGPMFEFFYQPHYVTGLFLLVGYLLKMAFFDDESPIRGSILK